MKIERVMKEGFSVIGKEGSTTAGEGFVARLWQEANGNFSQVAHLAKKDEDGMLVGIWGAMSDFSHQFMPWEHDFSEGLYLAGIECCEDADAPEGWTKWNVPGFEYLRVQAQEGVFLEMLDEIQRQGLSLTGAVQDFTDPQTGINYMYFPIRRI